MAQNVFISSVTAGLEQERRVTAALVAAMGMTPVRFEAFGASPMSSRERCLEAVATSDVYILLLGAAYGSADAGSGRSPTHEEFEVARARGIPILAFKKEGVEMEAAQVVFVDEVGRYATGNFWATFSDVGDLTEKVGQSLRSLPVSPAELRFNPIGRSVVPSWRTPPRGRDPYANALDATRIELYLTPLAPVGASRVRSVGDALPRILRSRGRLDETVAIRQTSSGGADTTATVDVPRTGHSFRAAVPESIGGLAVAADGEVSAWAELSRDTLGTLVSQASLSVTLARLADLAADAVALLFDDVDGVQVVASVAIVGVDRVVVGDPGQLGQRTSASVGFGREPVLALPGNESIDLGALPRMSGALGAELGAQLVARLGVSRA